jgi:hypothetical protein
MRFYRVNDDWLTHLEGEVRTDTLATLRGLSLNRLQKYPPPKLGGLPFGNESRVLGRYLNGRSSQMDPSALSSFYQSFASAEDKLKYRAFRANEALSREDWSVLIGSEKLDRWIEAKFLRVTENGSLVCQFCVVVLDNLVFMIDPLNDHGNPVETLALPGEYGEKDIGSEVQPFHHTYMGQDSLQMIEVMERNELPRGGRYLDCGPGAGGLLLYFSRRFDEAVGIDINPRAAKLSGINAELNRLKNVTTYHDDALKLVGRFGEFDLVSWNLPFIFMPEDWGDNAIDGYGGDLGIGLCLEFINSVPGLITKNGLACVAALAPILKTGENVLEERLRSRLATLGLDCTIRVIQTSLAPMRELWDFHQAAGIRKSESVYLYLTPGTGALRRIEPPATRKTLDALREKMYQRKFS